VDSRAWDLSPGFLLTYILTLCNMLVALSVYPFIVCLPYLDYKCLRYPDKLLLCLVKVPHLMEL